MKSKIKPLIALLVLGLQISSTVFAGHFGNNGGDHVRATFLRMGAVVSTYLKETVEGQALVARHNLDVAALDQTLSVYVIEVVDGLLLDNGGSVVDAIGVPGKIQLSGLKWMDHFEAERDVYFLVFHEMLRASAVNDDNYVISKAIQPFPQSRRIVTRTTSIYPLLGDSSVSSAIDPGSMRLIGPGCPTGLAGTFIDFDSERNQLDITFNRFDLAVGASLPTAARKACSLIIPYKPVRGMRLKVTQMDFTAKAELEGGTKAAIKADIVSGSAQTKDASIDALTSTRGRLLTRFGSVFESDCNGTGGLLHVVTAASIQAPTPSQNQVRPSVLNADRLSLSFVMERCPSQL